MEKRVDLAKYHHLFGLIGRKLTHSFSGNYFNSKFYALNLKGYYYHLFELDRVAEFPRIVRDYPNLRGINVTIPYKETVMRYLDTLDPLAERAGAVNTIKIEDGRKTGYNTDVTGFMEALTEVIVDRNVFSAIVLGTGGASKAVSVALQEMKIPFQRISRGGKKGLRYRDLTAEIIATADLIVNTTPLGMYPDIESKPDIPYENLTSDHILFDLVYNPEKTLFLAEGEARGCIVENGYHMLLNQAEAAWKIWTEKTDHYE